MTASDESKISRRAFAQHGVGLVAGLAAAQGMASVFEGYEPTTFTSRELAIVKALMARLIPADAKSGGAVEAGAHIYLDRALGAFHARHLATYRGVLAELDRLAQRAHSTGFAELPAAHIDAFIDRMERGEIREGSLPNGGATFFALVRRHTLEGFLSDPMYGGNREFIGWQVIGYNGVQLTYPPATQALNGRDERDARSIAAFGGSPLP